MTKVEVDVARIERAVREILVGIGEDPDREGLLDTPGRVARMFAETMSGLGEEPRDHLTTVFDADHDEMVMVRDVPFASTCEHHLVPFVGVAHVAYVPGTSGMITGLSKLARLVDGYARRPQVQERLTMQIANAIDTVLEPRGVLVVIEAEHMCMTIRGVRKPGALTVTSAVRGLFRQDARARRGGDELRHRHAQPLMGHPPGAAWLPLDAPALAADVERIGLAHGGDPAQLAELLRGRGPAGQLTAIAWVLDAHYRLVLLVRHPVLGWACPGGHVEHGEDPARAAARELFEETGLTVAAETIAPVTLTRVDMPADAHGPAHVHWNLGYRFTADPDAALVAEADRPVQWWPVDGLPSEVPADLADLLAVLAR